jgi:hypothetical protein
MRGSEVRVTITYGRLRTVELFLDVVHASVQLLRDVFNRTWLSVAQPDGYGLFLENLDASLLLFLALPRAIKILESI